MREEHQALVVNNMWELVPPSLDHNIIGYKWLYKIKQKPHGLVDHFKAQLVAHAFSQREDLDYDDTFSPHYKAHHHPSHFVY